MADPLLINLTGTESQGTKWAVLQHWLKLAVTNAGITIPMSDPLLTDINYADSEGTKWAKLQRWMTLLANNISGGGGGGTTLKGGSVAIVAGTQSYAITFTTPFGAAPTKLPAPVVMMPNSSGEVFDAAYDLSTLTANGVTVWLSGIPSAASSGGQIYWTAAA